MCADDSPKKRPKQILINKTLTVKTYLFLIVISNFRRMQNIKE